MALYAFAAVLICWVIWAYKMGFGEQWGKAPFVGHPGPILTIRNELQQGILPASGNAPLFPMATMAYFQFVFAAITVVIMAGAFLGRMNILAWMLFVPLWITFSYTVGAFSLWGGGFLQNLGVIDYAGGYVIHLSSGTAGFVGAALIGPRLEEDIRDFKAHNILLMLVGAGTIRPTLLLDSIF
jgi:ammonium transporter, Amt family